MWPATGRPSRGPVRPAPSTRTSPASAATTSARSCSVSRAAQTSPTGGDLVTIGLSTIAIDNASNTSTFAADRNFLMWGDDGAATTFSAADRAAVRQHRHAHAARLERAGDGHDRRGHGRRAGRDRRGGAALSRRVQRRGDRRRPTCGRRWHRSRTASRPIWPPTHDFTSGQFFTFATVIPEDLRRRASQLRHDSSPRTAHATRCLDTTRSTNTAPLMLGTAIDVESDGQPTATATGDDATGADDEDGVRSRP